MESAVASTVSRVISRPEELCLQTARDAFSPSKSKKLMHQMLKLKSRVLAVALSSCLLSTNFGFENNENVPTDYTNIKLEPFF